MIISKLCYRLSRSTSVGKQERNLMGRKEIESTQVTLLSSFRLKAHGNVYAAL